MSVATIRPVLPQEPEAADKPTPKLERLAPLYEGILTATVRVQTARQQGQDPENFRTRRKQALREVGATGARKGYSAEDVEEANSAVVAFLDETVWTCDACAEVWA